MSNVKSINFDNASVKSKKPVYIKHTSRAFPNQVVFESGTHKHSSRKKNFANHSNQY